MNVDWGAGFLWLLFILACAVTAAIIVALGVAVWGGIQHIQQQSREKEKADGRDGRH
jgi:hypothetical protein